MRLRYPKLGSDKFLRHQERLTSPLYVAGNGGTCVNVTPNNGAVFNGASSRVVWYGGEPASLVWSPRRWTIFLDLKIRAYGPSDFMNISGRTGVPGFPSYVVNFYQRRLEMFFYSEGGVYVGGFPLTTDAVVVGQRAQVAAAFDGSVTRGYINGVLGTSVGGVGTVSHSTAQFWLGGLQSGGFFDGTIYDERTWNRALSAAELLAIYNNREWA